MHRANEVRPVLSALSSLAEKYNFAAVCIRHLGKAAKGRAVYAGLGSIDFAAAARSMLLVAEHPEAPHMRVMAHVKSSLAPAGKSISYEIKDGALLWAGPTEHTAEDLLATKGFDNERGSSDEASEFLKELLAEGAQPAQDVLKAARDIGIAKRTLERAKKDLEVTSHRASAGNEGAGKWLWSLPSKHAGDLAALRDNPVIDAPLATPPSYTQKTLATLQDTREEHEEPQDRNTANEIPLDDDTSHLLGGYEGEL